MASPFQIWVVTCHQYGIPALVVVSQTSFCGETRCGVTKCRLFCLTRPSFTWLTWSCKTAVLSPVVNIKMVSSISTFVLNTLIVKYNLFFYYIFSNNIVLKHFAHHRALLVISSFLNPDLQIQTSRHKLFSHHASLSSMQKYGCLKNKNL